MPEMTAFRVNLRRNRDGNSRVELKVMWCNALGRAGFIPAARVAGIMPALPVGATVFLVLFTVLFPCHATSSLDDVLSCLESKGVLTDRSKAVQGGIEGILKSIDPEARVGGLLQTGSGAAGSAATQAVQRVELWPEDIAYIKLNGLFKGCGPGVLAQLQALSGKAGIILDLRDVSGDDVQAVSLLAGVGRPANDPLFLVLDNRNQLVSTNVVADRLSLKAPLMVLVDHGTKGAAEALAAAWRGCPGVMLIGSTTRGEARLREVVALPDGQLVTLAVRKLAPISGLSYEGRGVQPDVLVTTLTNMDHSSFVQTNLSGRALSPKSERDLDLMKRVDQDVPLRRATDIILGLRTLNGYGP
jgi:hypothetical protein